MRLATLLSLALSCLSCSLTASAAKNPKRGLCYAEDATHPGEIAVANQSASVVTWVYDWGVSPPSYLSTSNLKYIPMLWGRGGADTFASKVTAQRANIILAFNEPDFTSQSNIPPAEAAELWIKYIQPLRSQGVRLGAPSVTSAPSGAPWLTAFFAACKGCTIDFIPLHWYGDTIGGFYDYIWSMHGQFPGYPIWITEFASTSTDDAAVLAFLKGAQTYLDSLDWIERYSWFAFFRKEAGSNYNLLDANGRLTALGQAYINT